MVFSQWHQYPLSLFSVHNNYVEPLNIKIKQPRSTVSGVARLMLRMSPLSLTRSALFSGSSQCRDYQYPPNCDFPSLVGIVPLNTIPYSCVFGGGYTPFLALGLLNSPHWVFPNSWRMFTTPYDISSM